MIKMINFDHLLVITTWGAKWFAQRNHFIKSNKK